ncbi:MAG: HAMP domain-containing sensor histidine kinase [Thermodesulfobacteriota bacterium]
MAEGRILVVEDDLVTAEVVRRCLEGESYTVEVVGDGLAASRALAAERPDLIILDLMLPNLDGWELCAMIRTLPDPVLSSVPIVMLTSRSTAEDRVRGLRAGADDYITKPFTLEELVLKIQRLLDPRRRPPATAGPRDAGAPQRELEDVYDLLHHELKNHLIAISGFARRVDLQAETISRHTLKRYVGFIRKSADHLSGFVEDVLHFRKLQEGRLDLEPEPVSLQETVEDVLSLHAGLARDKHIALRNEVGRDVPPVRFDPGAAKICLSNLMENAIKYTPQGGTVSARAGLAGDGRVALEVQDTGPGVPPDEREKIFAKFYRGRRTERSTKGTGLGLYVVRSLARSLDADVTLEPGEGGGSRFRLVFRPAAAKADPAPT